MLDNWRYKDRIVDVKTAKFIIVAFNFDSSTDDNTAISELYSNVSDFKNMIDLFKV